MNLKHAAVLPVLFRVAPMLLFVGVPGLVTLHAQGVPAGRLAALEQDLAAMREEVQRLREEVQDLKSENNGLRAQIRSAAPNASAGVAALQRQLAAEASARANADQALESRVDAKLKSALAAVNNAIARLNTQPPPAPPQGNSEPSAAPVPAPGDIPKTAVEHTVQSGDNPEKLARRYKSKTSWILYVNPKLNPKNLKVGQKILIPVHKEPDPPAQ
ncbi:MAG: LysM peptidoglycan-binding domain-containing protein [Puniceicoccales bacterium]|jgi:LysM repeat protein|nr:LysM peptidoglycan-binding domain-containing protein [Puniceicoccales bacterium]